jgi:hypothetical protein
MEKRIIVKLNIEGLHYWLDCPIEEVAYLKQLHRHMFHIKIEKNVTHNDRDIEIIEFKHNILQYLRLKYYNSVARTHCFNNMSCEMIAQEILETFDADSVEVLEDNENGAIIRR